MKKSVYILFIFVIFVSVASCKKDTENKSITTNWTGTGYIQGEPYGFSLTLHQSGTKITGNFMSDDESVYGSLTSESTLDGTDIDFYFEETYQNMTMNFYFTGTLNEALDHMEGEYYANDVDLGFWSADKDGAKAAINVGQRANNKLIDQIKGMFN